MQSVEIHGLRQVQEAFERLPEAVRRAKAEVFEAVGEYLHLCRAARGNGGGGRGESGRRRGRRKADPGG